MDTLYAMERDSPLMMPTDHSRDVVEQFKKERRSTRLREATYAAIKRLILSGVLTKETPLA